MQRTRPIMIIEDDLDDQELLQETFRSLDYPNPVIFFSNGKDALNYLHQTSAPPALIISDINMPRMNGFEVKKRIDRSPELGKLDIPFVFLTTQSSKNAEACSVSDHRFFTKPNTMVDLHNTIKTIVEHWVPRYSGALYIRQPERGLIF